MRIRKQRVPLDHIKFAKHRKPPQQKTKRGEDEEVYIPIESVLKQFNKAIPENGGRYTIDSLAQKVERFYPGLSAIAMRNLIRRVLEFSVRVRAGKAVPMFIGIWTVSGKLMTRRPSGVPPVGDSVTFEPKGL